MRLKKQFAMYKNLREIFTNLCKLQLNKYIIHCSNTIKLAAVDCDLIPH